MLLFIFSPLPPFPHTCLSLTTSWPLSSSDPLYLDKLQTFAASAFRSRCTLFRPLLVFIFFFFVSSFPLPILLPPFLFFSLPFPTQSLLHPTPQAAVLGANSFIFARCTVPNSPPPLTQDRFGETDLSIVSNTSWRLCVAMRCNLSALLPLKLPSSRHCAFQSLDHLHICRDTALFPFLSLSPPAHLLHSHIAILFLARSPFRSPSSAPCFIRSSCSTLT